MHIEFIDDFVARFQFPTAMQNAKQIAQKYAHNFVSVCSWIPETSL